MPGLTSGSLRTAAARTSAAMAGLEETLNAADGKLGDGDTGQTVRRVLEAVAAAAAEAPDDLGETFAGLARASAGASGSSLGTLFTVALLTFARATRGRTAVPWSELGALLAQAGAAMASRGGAAPGDKTVLDGVDAVATAIAGQEDAPALAEAARDAAEHALAAFRDHPCRIGRARMFADRSVGLDDPGMLAFARLVAAITGSSGGPT